MNEHEKINYVELPAKDFQKTKDFFTSVFNWSFTDYGPDYMAFNQQGIEGGFYRSDLHASTETGSALIVFYSKALESTLNKITAAGGTISQQTFPFPGGRRFHFLDPNKNEFAVWSDK